MMMVYVLFQCFPITVTNGQLVTVCSCKKIGNLEPRCLEEEFTEYLHKK